MYNKFFGFKEKPFKLVPNPEYLFLSKSHEEALGHLTYAVSQGDGFVEIIGEVGTGKTTLCRVFLDGLDESVDAAYIFNPKLDALQLLKTINDEFSISSTPDNIKELIDILNAFLIAKKAVGKRIIVLVDEAQNLSKEVLEQLRLLSNLETTQDKLLQIILVGQPELAEMLGSHELRQLGQRIAINCNLSPLSFQETTEYISHRIALASHRAGPPFDRAAFRAIYKYSRGIPRLINIACDRILLNAFSRNSYNVSGSIAKEAIKELTKMHDTQPSSNLQRKPSFTVLASVLIISLILLLHFTFNAPNHKPVANDHVQEAKSTQTEQLIPGQLPESKSSEQDSHIQQTAVHETVAHVPEPADKQSLSVIPETGLVTEKDKKSHLADTDLVSVQEEEQPAAQIVETTDMVEQLTTNPAFEKGSPQTDNEAVQDADPASVQEQEEIVPYSVHAGSFKTLQEADDLVEELRAKNYPSFLYTEADGNGNLVSIVVAGKYLSKDLASQASAKLSSQGYDTFLAKAKSSPSVGPPVNAARPASTKESKAFHDFLYSLNARHSRNNAMQEALMLWLPGATVTQGLNKINADRVFFQQVADQHDMMLQPIATDLKSIQHLNLPAILAIYLPNHLWPKYLTVVAIGNNQVTFSLSDSSEPLTVDSEVLYNYWSGEGYLLWKNFAGIHGTISQSSHNESVRALKQLLHDLGNRNIVVNQMFDNNTLQAVKKIQLKYGLREDGKVGPLTKIALYNENEAFNKPGLANLH
jgi:type II secretory pathway predicted ATPase ExeA/murein L,D-transpeptidase YcbB/YkuD